MDKPPKVDPEAGGLPATISAPRPGDFPLGSVQSRAAARALVEGHASQRAAEFANLTPYEAAVAEGEEDPAVARELIRLAKTAEVRALIYGYALETPEEIRHLKRVAKRANELAGGHLQEIGASDPGEAARFRNLAEEQLKAEASDRQEDLEQNHSPDPGG